MARRWNNYSDVKVDSAWEDKLRTGVLKGLAYHPEKVFYQVDHTYEPDWKYGNILIEAKGRFRESSEAAKYKWVRKSLRANEELVFLFMKPNTPMPHAKRRKDGTKQTHAQWAERNGFRWYTEENIHELWK